MTKNGLSKRQGPPHSGLREQKPGYNASVCEQPCRRLSHTGLCKVLLSATAIAYMLGAPGLTQHWKNRCETQKL